MSDQITTLQEQLQEVSGKLVSCRKIPRHLKDLEKQIKLKRRDFRQAEKTLRKEESDVNKLERASVKSLFYRFLKSRDRQLDIELQEYVASALTYNSCLEEIELMEYEMDVLTEKLDALPALEEKWKKLIEQKEKLIKRQYPAAATRLKVLDHSAMQVMLLVREIDEAILAGIKAKTLLRSIWKYLQKIDGWGMWYDGAGRYSSYAKKSLIDKARKKAVQADLALHQFDVELADVFKKLKIADTFSIDAFEHFLDIFYNNLITDWIVQRNLKNTINNVQSALDSTERYLASLRKEKKTQEKKLKEIDKRKEDLIYSTS